MQCKEKDCSSGIPNSAAFVHSHLAVGVIDHRHHRQLTQAAARCMSCQAWATLQTPEKPGLVAPRTGPSLHSGLDLGNRGPSWNIFKLDVHVESGPKQAWTYQHCLWTTELSKGVAKADPARLSGGVGRPQRDALLLELPLQVKPVLHVESIEHVLAAEEEVHICAKPIVDAALLGSNVTTSHNHKPASSDNIVRGSMTIRTKSIAVAAQLAGKVATAHSNEAVQAWLPVQASNRCSRL